MYLLDGVGEDDAFAASLALRVRDDLRQPLEAGADGLTALALALDVVFFLLLGREAGLVVVGAHVCGGVGCWS